MLFSYSGLLNPPRPPGYEGAETRETKDCKKKKKKGNKLVAKWRGPMKVVDTVNEWWVYRVKDIITGHEMVVYAERLP